MLLHIIMHHLKNKVVKFKFIRFGETVSKYFHNAVHSIIHLHKDLLKKFDSILKSSTDEG